MILKYNKNAYIYKFKRKWLKFKKNAQNFTKWSEKRKFIKITTHTNTHIGLLNYLNKKKNKNLKLLQNAENILN